MSSSLPPQLNNCVQTQFYYYCQEVPSQDGPPVYQLKRPNYNPYQLFCFHTKLSEKLADKTYFLVPKKVGCIMYLAVQLAGGQECEHLAEYIAAAHQEAKGKALLFSARYSLIHNGIVLPKLWVESILSQVQIIQPYYTVDDQPGLFSFKPEFIKGALYVRLPQQDDYKTCYLNLKQEILAHLVYLYQLGTVALPKQSPLICKWHLTELTPGLYTAAWDYPLFAYQKSDFLLGLASGSKSITLGIEKVYQAAIGKKLTNQHFFHQDKLTIFVSDLEDAQRAVLSVQAILDQI